MTTSEVKKQISAVLNALDSVSVSGYMNLCNLQGSMAVLQSILKSDISDDKQVNQEN